MASRGESIHKYSHILLTILRSKLHPFQMYLLFTDRSPRVLLATIQDKGLCPCPRCLIPKENFHCTGFLSDILARLSRARTHFQHMVLNARRAIYEFGKPLKGVAVERMLKSYLLVPTVVSPSESLFSLKMLIGYAQNSFIEHLSGMGFNIYPSLVVDILHEFNLGVLKSCLQHLFRIFYRIDPTRIIKLNERLVKDSICSLN